MILGCVITDAAGHVRSFSILVTEIKSIRIRLEEFQWKWQEDNQRFIVRHFEHLQRKNINLWNGKIYLCFEWSCRQGDFQARVFETNFASFISHREIGWPDKMVFVVFGSTLVEGIDGGIVLGRMAGNTASPNEFLFPSGALSEIDVTESGTFDIHKTIKRELKEETGLSDSDGRLSGLFYSVCAEKVCIFSKFVSHQRLARVVSQLNLFACSTSSPELVEFVGVKSKRDLECLHLADFCNNVLLNYLD